MYNPYQQQQYNPYLQQLQQMQAQQQGAANNSLVNVRSEAEARNYPVAPGNSVTFKDENAAYIYTKTMGFSQLDRPVFEKFKLVREAETAQNAFISQGFSNEVDALYNRLNNCPVPTTPVYGRTPIFTCNNNGCGCGCGNF